MGKGMGPTRLLSNWTLLSTAEQYHASIPLLRDARPRAGSTVSVQYLREYIAESPKQDSKRFNSQRRRNTLPIWVYNLSMGTVLQGRLPSIPTDITAWHRDSAWSQNFFTVRGRFWTRDSAARRATNELLMTQNEELVQCAYIVSANRQAGHLILTLKLEQQTII